MSDLKIQYEERKLDTIIAYFVKGFRDPVAQYDYFCDTARGVVILKLYTRESVAPEEGRRDGE